MFIFVCMIACVIIFGIVGHKDGDTELGVLMGILVGTVGGLLSTLIMSVWLFFVIPPVTAVETHELEQHTVSSYVYYVNVDDSEYSFAYFDGNKIINVDNVKNVSFDFDEKSRKVKVQEKKMGGALDVLFFNFYQTEYDITIPSKEYIRYE